MVVQALTTTWNDRDIIAGTDQYVKVHQCPAL